MNSPFLISRGVSAEAIASLEATNVEALYYALLSGELAVSVSGARVAVDSGNGYIGFIKPSVFQEIVSSLWSDEFADAREWRTRVEEAFRYANDEILESAEDELSANGAWLSDKATQILFTCASDAWCPSQGTAAAYASVRLVPGVEGVNLITDPLYPDQGGLVTRDEMTGLYTVDVREAVREVCRAVVAARLGVHVPVVAAGMYDEERLVVIQSELQGTLATVWNDRLATYSASRVRETHAGFAHSLVRCARILSRVNLLVLGWDPDADVAATLWSDKEHATVYDALSEESAGKVVWRTDAMLRRMQHSYFVEGVPHEFLEQLMSLMAVISAISMRNADAPLTLNAGDLERVWATLELNFATDIWLAFEADESVLALRRQLRALWDDQLNVPPSQAPSRLSSPRTPARPPAPPSPRPPPAPARPPAPQPLRPPVLVQPPPPPPPPPMPAPNQEMPDAGVMATLASPPEERPPPTQPLPEDKSQPSALLEAIRNPKRKALKKPAPKKPAPKPKVEEDMRAVLKKALSKRLSTVGDSDESDKSDESDDETWSTGAGWMGACPRVAFRPASAMRRRTHARTAALGEHLSADHQGDAARAHVAEAIHDAVLTIASHVAWARAAERGPQGLADLKQEREVVGDYGFTKMTLSYAMRDDLFTKRLARVNECEDALDLLSLMR